MHDPNTRRGFLRGLGHGACRRRHGRSRGPRPGISPVLAAGPAEAPGVARVADKAEALAAAYTAARQRRKEAIALYHSLCPVPDELVATREDWRLFGFCGSRNAIGPATSSPRPSSRSRDILRLRELEELLAEYRPRSKRARILRRKMAVAKAYEQARKNAEAASGLWAAHNAPTARRRPPRGRDEGQRGVVAAHDGRRGRVPCRRAS